jgi:uncharacterized protein DUF4833
MRNFLLSFFLLLFAGHAFGDGGHGHKHKIADSASMPISLPVPPITSNRLFYVQRTPNTNTIVYDVNMDAGGKPDPDEPVKVYWMKFAERGQKEDLNFIQRRFAYGLNATALGNDSYDIRFVSYKKFKLTLMKAPDGKYHIFASISQKQAILNRIFIKIDGGSFWIPNVLYVQVNGTDPVTGKEMVERFKP